MMNDKKQLLEMLRDEFNRWDNLLSSLSEEQITARQLPGNWSIKDVVAHLWAWQQRSIARMEAARDNHEPRLPGWPTDLNPESEEDLEKINAWIYETNRDRTWKSVYDEWRSGYLRFIKDSEAIPEKDLFEVGKYPWLKKYPLSAVMEGAYGHHREEHYGPLLAWLKQHNQISQDSG